MQRLLYLALTLTAGIVLSAGSTTAGASSKFAYTRVVDSATGNLVVNFDEGGQKRFTSVDYRLDATAVVTYTDADRTVVTPYSPSDTVTGLPPDGRGRVTGSLTLDDVPPSGLTCSCMRSMEYSAVTLTNLSTGHVYRLEPIAG